MERIVFVRVGGDYLARELGLSDILFGRLCLRVPLEIGGQELSSFAHVGMNLTKGRLSFMFSKDAAVSRHWMDEFSREDSPFFLPNSKLKANVAAGARTAKNDIIAKAIEKSPPESVAVLRYGKNVHLNVLINSEPNSIATFWNSIGHFAHLDTPKLLPSWMFQLVRAYPREVLEGDNLNIQEFLVLPVHQDDVDGEYIWFWFESDMIFMLNVRESFRKEEGRLKCPNCGTSNETQSDENKSEVFAYLKNKTCTNCGAPLLGVIGYDAIRVVDETKKQLRKIESDRYRRKARLTELINTRMDFINSKMLKIGKV